MNEKDKALLDYMWGQIENLIDFMERNGYDRKDYASTWMFSASQQYNDDPFYLKATVMKANGDELTRHDGKYVVARTRNEVTYV